MEDGDPGPSIDPDSKPIKGKWGKIIKPDAINGSFQFFEKFPTEESAIDYCIKLRWDDNVTCPYCTNNKIYKIQQGKKFKCAKCRNNFTVKTGTIMNSSKLPVRSWIRAMHLLSSHKKGYTSINLAHELNISQNSAWHMATKIRIILNQTHKGTSLLSGIVEMDEAYMGRKRKLEPGEVSKRGRGSRKVLLVGMVERNGNVVIVPTKRPDRADIEKIAKEFIDSEAYVMTDGSNYYDNFKHTFKTHDWVNHSQKEYARGIVNTNTIEGVWSTVRNGILLTYHSVTDKYIDLYASEYAYRYSNRKRSRADLLNEIVFNCDRIKITNKQLKKRLPQIIYGTNAPERKYKPGMFLENSSLSKE